MVICKICLGVEYRPNLYYVGPCFILNSVTIHSVLKGLCAASAFIFKDLGIA